MRRRRAAVPMRAHRRYPARFRSHVCAGTGMSAPAPAATVAQRRDPAPAGGRAARRRCGPPAAARRSGSGRALPAPGLLDRLPPGTAAIPSHGSATQRVVSPGMFRLRLPWTAAPRAQPADARARNRLRRPRVRGQETVRHLDRGRPRRVQHQHQARAESRYAHLHGMVRRRGTPGAARRSRHDRRLRRRHGGDARAGHRAPLRRQHRRGAPRGRQPGWADHWRDIQQRLPWLDL